MEDNQMKDEVIAALERQVYELETALVALNGSRHTLLRVMDFHEAFGHPTRFEPQVPSFEERKLRVNLIVEEVGEFIVASGLMDHVTFKLFDTLERYLKNATEEQFAKAPAPHMVEAADALADIDYVIQGANLVWGFPAEAIGEEVHKSNMSKLGLDGQPIHREDGKVIKGPNYFPPRIEAILFPNKAIELIEKQQGITAEVPPVGLPRNPLPFPRPLE